MKIGENIRIWRQLKSLKQEDLAKRLGVEASTLSNIENNVSKPNVDMLEAIALALEIEISQLFTNPQQLLSFNNCTNSCVYGTQHNQNIDKLILERLILLMEKITTHFMQVNDKSI